MGTHRADKPVSEPRRLPPLLALPHAPRSKETGANVKVQSVFPTTLNLSRINDQTAYTFEFLRSLSEITVGREWASEHLKPRSTPLAQAVGALG